MPNNAWNVDRVRAEFPALAVADDNRARLFLDAPGGTQVPKRVIERVTRHARADVNRQHGGEGQVIVADVFDLADLHLAGEIAGHSKI